MAIHTNNAGERVYESEEYGSAYWYNQEEKIIEWCAINEDDSYDMASAGEVETWDETDKAHIMAMLGLSEDDITN